MKKLSKEESEILFQKIESAREDVDISSTNYMISNLLTEIEEETINLSPDFQREYIVNRKDLKSFASKLIESILLDIPIPPVYLAEQAISSTVLDVIDGQQRMTTIKCFADGKFPNGEPFVLSGLTELPFLNEMAYCDLPKSVITKFKRYKIVAFILKNSCPPDAKFKIFHRLNQGSLKLSNQEIRNNLYRGLYTDSTKKAAELEAFQRIKDQAIREHYRDREIFLAFTAINHEGKYSNISASKLNSIMEIGNKWSEATILQIVSDFEEFLEKTYLIFGNGSFRRNCFIKSDGQPAKRGPDSVFNIGIFLSLVVALRDIEKSSIQNNLTASRESLEKAFSTDEFNDTFGQSTTSPKKVMARANLFIIALSRAFNKPAPVQRFSASDEILSAVIESPINDFLRYLIRNVITIDNDSLELIKNHTLYEPFSKGRLFESYADLVDDIENDDRFWLSLYGSSLIDKVLSVKDKIMARLKERR